MLRTFDLQCRTAAPSVYCDWAAYLHGYLMEKLPVDVAASSHASGLRPFSQYILPESGGFRWRISCWDDRLSDAFSALVREGAEISLRQKGADIAVEAREESSVTDKQLFSRFFLSEEPTRQVELRLLTPCAHRSGNAYVLFPSAELILNSLYRRFCTFAEVLSIEDEAVQREITASVRIARYAIRSAVYHVGGGGVTGYTGSLTLRIDGNAQLARLAGMLLSFAPYAGVGAKTALGMGGCAFGANPAARRPVSGGKGAVRTENQPENTGLGIDFDKKE